MKHVGRKGVCSISLAILSKSAEPKLQNISLVLFWTICGNSIVLLIPMWSEQSKTFVKASAFVENTLQFWWNTTSRTFLLQVVKSIDWRKSLFSKSSSTEFSSESVLVQFVQFVLGKFKSPQTKAMQSFGMQDKIFSSSSIEYPHLVDNYAKNVDERGWNFICKCTLPSVLVGVTSNTKISCL